jgi:flagellar motor switch protein FliG
MAKSDANPTLDKCAIILLCMGEEPAAQVMRHMGPKEVQQVGVAMSKIKNVSPTDVEKYIDEILVKLRGQSTLGLDSQNYIRSVLTKALGEEKAYLLLDRILHDSDTSGIEGLKWMDPATVSELIRDEHPQVIATILVHLERDHAAAILNRFSDRLRADVIMRVSTLEGIQPSALRDLNHVLSKVMSGSEKIKKQTLGGTKVAAEILNFVGGGIDQTVLESVREQDSELAQKIQDEMFVFDNIIEIDNRGIQAVLREVSNDLLILALKAANDELRDKIFGNMSSRAAESLKEDLEGRGPVKLSEVEGAQKEILKIVRKLADAGTIVISGGGDDALV